MAKIKLMKSEFTRIPEGQYIFKVDKVTYDEDFGDMKIDLITKDGLKHVERFGLVDKNGEPSEPALKAFSYTAHVLLNNRDVEEIDEQDLVGCYMRATVIHEKSTTVNPKTNQPYVNVKLSDKESTWGFDADKKQPAPATEETISLDDLDELV